MLQDIRYAFTSNRSDLPGNVLLGLLDGQAIIRSDQPILITSSPERAFNYMESNSKLFKCKVASRYTVKEVQVQEYSKPGTVYGVQGSSGFTMHIRGCTGPAAKTTQFAELATCELEVIGELKVSDFINTDEFRNWLLRNVVVNLDYIEQCFSSFDSKQRLDFIKRFPFDVTARYLIEYNSDEVDALYLSNYEEFEAQILSGELKLAEPMSDRLLRLHARLFPYAYVGHTDDLVRIEAEAELAKLMPKNYVYHTSKRVRSVAYTTAVALEGEQVVSHWLDYTKETDNELKLLKLNVYSCHHFINDDDFDIRCAARRLRNTIADRIWLKFNKG